MCLLSEPSPSRYLCASWAAAARRFHDSTLLSPVYRPPLTRHSRAVLWEPASSAGLGRASLKERGADLRGQGALDAALLSPLCHPDPLRGAFPLQALGVGGQGSRHALPLCQSAWSDTGRPVESASEKLTLHHHSHLMDLACGPPRMGRTAADLCWR